MDLNATMCCFNCENIPAGLFLLLWRSSDGIRAERAELCSEAAVCWHSCLSRPINKCRIFGAVRKRGPNKQTCSPVGRLCVNTLKRRTCLLFPCRFACEMIVKSHSLYCLLWFLQSFVLHHPPSISRGEPRWELHICRVRGGEGGAQREESVF